MFQYTSCSATIHPLTHTHTYQHPSYHKPIHSQRLTTYRAWELAITPMPCTATGTYSIHSLHQKSLFRIPFKPPFRSSPHFHPAGWGISETPSVFPYLLAKVELALTLEKGIRTHCPVALPIHIPCPDICAGICKERSIKVSLASLSLVLSFGQPPHFPY